MKTKINLTKDEEFNLNEKIKKSEERIKELDKLIKKSRSCRYNFGNLDLGAGLLVILGVYFITQNYLVGYILAVLGVLKQFSGK